MTDKWAMSDNYFDTLISRWGSDIDGWPPADKAAGMLWIEQSATARDTLRQMAALEADLERVRQEAVPPLHRGLEERILADAATIAADFAAPPRAQTVPAKRPLVSLFSVFMRGWRPAGVFTASAALGIWIGYTAPGNIAEAAASLLISDAAEEFVGLELEDNIAMEIDVARFDQDEFR